MDRLLVETKELRPEYKERNRLWEKFYKRFCLTLVTLTWKQISIIHYNVVVDIELGTMKYYYFKHGMGYVIRRIKNYHSIVGHRSQNRNVDIDPKDFYIQTLLTDTKQVEEQLNRELIQHYHNG